jgi:cation diffusion facilitator CzcD-associated flavoprotein CzcO
LGENKFSTIDIIEQQPTVGGVWNHYGNKTSEEPVVVPTQGPSSTLVVPPGSAPLRKQNAAPTSGGNGYEPTKKTRSGCPVFPSAMYDSLEANIPRQLMQYSDFAFPDDIMLFPTRELVLEYLEEYAKEVLHLVKFNTQVVQICPREAGTLGCGWMVETRDLLTGKTIRMCYDAVVVASGHFSEPFIPKIPGVQEWNVRFPGVISHSMTYLNPEPFKNKVSAMTK